MPWQKGNASLRFPKLNINWQIAINHKANVNMICLQFHSTYVCISSHNAIIQRTSLVCRSKSRYSTIDTEWDALFLISEVWLSSTRGCVLLCTCDSLKRIQNNTNVLVGVVAMCGCYPWWIQVSVLHLEKTILTQMHETIFKDILCFIHTLTMYRKRGVSLRCRQTQLHTFAKCNIAKSYFIIHKERIISEIRHNNG